MNKIKNITVDQEKDLLKKAKESKGKVKDLAMKSIINYNLNLVKYIVTRYFSFAKLDYEELVSEGIKSLPKAVNKFDLESKNRFAVYAGCWIKQYIRSYIEKTHFFKTNPTKKREVVYYDDCLYKNEKNSYSFLETLSCDSYENEQESIRNNDINKTINKLINYLDNKDMIICVRLFYKINIKTLYDLYLLLDNEEKKIFLKENKISTKSDIKNIELNSKKIEKSLSEINLENKKINNPIFKKYLDIFNNINKIKFADISTFTEKTENCLRKLKQEALFKLKNLIQEKNINIDL